MINCHKSLKNHTVLIDTSFCQNLYLVVWFANTKDKRSHNRQTIDDQAYTYI